ncbi:MAG: DNA-binding response regulator [Proteobacteria bacterium]|nr:DNA-binding response regulator [Pseudomonadota bacterium]
MVDLIIADDHTVLREALCEMLQSKGKYQVVAQARDGEELLSLLQQRKPDIIIMDMSMPKVDGLEALQKLGSVEGGPPVLMLSADQGERTVRAAIKAGAKGYVPKNAGIEELEFAISSILSGKTYLSPSVTSALFANGANGSAPQETLVSALTTRELEIMKLIAEGHPNRVIAKMLHISTRTVDTHRSNILKKLKVKTNAELVKIAIQSELISL